MNDDRAKLRYMIIQVQRLIGLFFVLLGLMVLYDRIDWPEIAGYAFVLIGLLDALIVPSLLARRWRTPPE